MIVNGEVAITTCTSWWLKGRLRQTPVFFYEREKWNLDTICRCFAVRRYTSRSLRRLHRRLSIFRRQQAETEAEKNPRFPGVILRNYRPRSSGWIHRWSKGTVLPSDFFSIRKKKLLTCISYLIQFECYRLYNKKIFVWNKYRPLLSHFCMLLSKLSCSAFIKCSMKLIRLSLITTLLSRCYFNLILFVVIRRFLCSFFRNSIF